MFAAENKNIKKALFSALFPAEHPLYFGHFSYLILFFVPFSGRFNQPTAGEQFPSKPSLLGVIIITLDMKRQAFVVSHCSLELDDS